MMMTLLYLIASVQAIGPVDDPDMWWRFRTGQWIIDNHSIPTEDYFSRPAMGQPWIEYSWMFELLIYWTYALFDLPGVMYGVVLMALLITFASHRLVRVFELPITIEVRDNGPGVPEDMVDHLFEPSISTKRRGSGLGLSLVAKIVADHRDTRAGA